MKKLFTILFSIVITQVFGVSITGLSPTSGPIGTSVTISGTGFNATAANNTVWFGGVKANIDSASTTKLKVTVPIGAMHEPIRVLVSGSGIAESPIAFVVTYGFGFISSSSMEVKVDFATGTNPYSVSIGDLDGDGKLDLAIVNIGSNTVSVYRNTSTSGSIISGSFATKVDFVTGTNPYSVTIGDLDGDGKLDLASANSTSNTVSVLRNTSTSGTISFATKVDFVTGTQPRDLSIGDLDGDGKLDLAVANITSNTVSVFRNISTSGSITSGSFATKVDFGIGTGASPNSLTMGDIDGDEKLDLVVANLSNTVSVLRNTSTSGTITSGSFATRVNVATGNGIRSVSLGDIDGDGKLDLAVANYSSSSVSVLKNVGQYLPPAITSFTPTSGPSGSIVNVTGVNFTGTTNVKFGGTDAISFTVVSSTSIDAILGSGSGVISVTNPAGTASSTGIFTYIPPPTITNLSPTSGAIGSSVTITGINFDTSLVKNIVWFGGVRAIVTNATSNALTVIVPVGATHSPIRVMVNGKIAESPNEFVVTYIGGFISTSAMSASIPSFATKVDFAIGTGPKDVSFGDLDGDGKLDLVVVNYVLQSVSIYKNTATNGTISSGSFGAKMDFAIGIDPIRVSIADLDGDGKLDLVVVNANSTTVSVLRNTSTIGTISFATKLSFVTGNGPNNASIGDIDGDGKLDLAVANYFSNTVSIFKNISTIGTISFSTKVDFAVGNSPYSLSLGDLDGDGKLDLAVVNFSSDSVSVLRNISTIGAITNGSFATKVGFASGVGPLKLSIGDLDGDRKLDLVTVNLPSNTVSVFRNTSTIGTLSIGSFATKVDFPCGNSPRSVSFGDFDGDGKLDLAIASSNASAVSVLRNISTNGLISSGSFETKVDFTTGNGSESVVNADIDGDGKLDLAVANYSLNSVSVLKNIGYYLPPSISSFTPTSGPSGSIVNITGTNFAGTTNVKFGGTNASSFTIVSSTKISAIFGSGTTGKITVTNPAGTAISNGIFFRAPTITNLSPLSGAIGSSVTITGTDFDTSIANNTIWFGGIKASITAATSTTLSVIVPPGAMHAPIRVLVAGNIAQSPKAFIVTYSKGYISTSSFATKVDFATATNPYSLTNLDIDGDCKLDLVVVSIYGVVSVYRNTSTSGTITSENFATKVDFYAGKGKVSFADIDGDGKLDLASANTNSVWILRNTSTSGTISFAERVDFATDAGDGLNLLGLSIGDLDGDGKLDLVVASPLSKYSFGSYFYTFSVYKNTSTIGTISSMSFATKVDFVTDSIPSSVSIGDLDGDGKLDLAVTNFGSSKVSVFKNTSNIGTISFWSKADFETGINPNDISIGDIDGDGKLDLAVANSNSNSVSILRNYGTIGNFNFPIKLDFETGNYPNSISIGDLDGDGKLDLVAANYLSNTVSVLRNTSTIETVSFATKVDFSTGNYPSCVSIGDIDGDEKLDLAIVNNGSNTVSILRNVGQNQLPSITSFTPTNASTGATVTITGTNFTGATSVKFGGINASSFNVVSATSITALVGSGATGIIAVSTPGGTANSAGIFTFNSAPILSPNLIYPQNSATNLPVNFMFKWDGVPTATNYNFKLSDVSSFSSLIKDTITNDITYNVYGLNANTNYYWKVNAINTVGSGPFSPVWSFLTKSSTSINNNTILEGYSIYQSHPNPFSTSTTFKFELQNDLFVKIEIYNSFGQLIQTLLNEKMPAKIHEVIWDAEKFSTGLYFYKIELTDINNPNKCFFQTSKMILVK